MCLLGCAANGGARNKERNPDECNQFRVNLRSSSETLFSHFLITT